MDLETLRYLFEKSPAPMALIEGPEYRIVFANAANRRLLGREDIIGKTVSDAFSWAEEGFLDLLGRVYRTGEPFEGSMLPFRIKSASPAGEWETRYLDFVYRPLRNAEGDVTSIFAEGHDVTAHYRTQERIRALQMELIHVSRVNAMGNMAATLAHELNQPFTAISNYASGTERLVARGGDIAEVAEPLKAIGRNAHRAGEVIRRLRQMTRRGQVTREIFDASEMIREAVEFALMGLYHSTQVTFELPDDISVFADPVQLQQVVINFVKNAFEANDGSIDLRVSAAAAHGFIEVRVEDSGPGIPPEIHEHLFDSFFSTKAEGMGIGLSISRTIIEAHGGSIWAENLNPGTAFCFKIPLDSEEKPNAPMP